MTAVKPLLTVKDVVDLTRLSKSKIHVLIGQGTLPSVRLLGVDRALIDPAELRAFVQAGRQHPNAD